MRTPLILLTFAAVLATAATGLAWTPISGGNPTWPGTVPYKLHSAGSDDVDIDTLEAETVRGMREWTTAECTGLTVDYQGRTPSGPANNNTIGWQESGWTFGAAALGVTSPRFSVFPTSSITSADMVMNGENWTWSKGGAGGNNTADIFTVVMHEGGHYYGLGHTLDAGSVMFPAAVGAQVLSADDTEGICTLYPGDGSPRDCTVVGCGADEECVNAVCVATPGGCASDRDCGAGQVCQVGACVTAPATDPNTMQPGAGCASDLECPTGQHCDLGTCALRPSCTTHAQCATGQACMAGQCMLTAMPGAAMDPADALGPGATGQECVMDADCASGLCRVQGANTLCALRCDTDACPLGMVCGQQNGLWLCEGASGAGLTPGTGPFSSTSGGQADGGCNLSRVGRRGGGMAWLCLLLLAVTVRRHR